jgi:predicted nucleic acid-binding protein
MLLFDTSVWVDHFRNNETPAAQLLKEQLLNDEPILICPPIYQEILQGIKNQNDLITLLSLLEATVKLEWDNYEIAKEAALLYNSLRQQGITINKPFDFQIAVYAMKFDLELAHNDSDFNTIAKHSSLNIFSNY